MHDFVWLSFNFCLFCSVSDGKSCFCVRKSISTSQRRAEHPFAGRNTQHLFQVFHVQLFQIYIYKCSQSRIVMSMGLSNEAEIMGQKASQLRQTTKLYFFVSFFVFISPSSLHWIIFLSFFSFLFSGVC